MSNPHGRACVDPEVLAAEYAVYAEARYLLTGGRVGVGIGPHVGFASFNEWTGEPYGLLTLTRETWLAFGAHGGLSFALNPRADLDAGAIYLLTPPGLWLRAGVRFRLGG